MTYFDVDELQLIVKRGDGKYDFSPEFRFYQISIIKRINELDASDILNFLDYHFNDNQFQCSFAAIVFYYSKSDKWINDKNVKTVIRNWLEGILPLEFGVINSLFAIIFDKSELDKNSRIKELTSNIDLYEKVEILSFCTFITEEGMMIHRKRFGITY